MKSGPVLIGIPGLDLDETSRRHLQHPAVGGVVLFSRNYRDREQLMALVSSIRDCRKPRLLVCIDQEGGRVQRLKESFTQLPPLGVLGALHEADPVKALDMAYRHGRVMATEMLACGIDLSFAPVLDLDRGSRVIGDRSFAADPAVVTLLGRSYIAGMHDAGMKTTGKHFPGHGSIEADSHQDDVCDPRPLEQIRAEDLSPFTGLMPGLDALMIAHVVYPRVDNLPAGYSPRWLREILKGEMGYEGVIFSDDLGMHAAKTVGGVRQRANACLEAGCDLVLVCLPGDVEELLSREFEYPDATAIIGRLYGRPTVDGDELEIVREERIREWGHWQRSLQALNDQSWA